LTKPGCRYQSPVVPNFITKTVLKLANLPSIQLSVALSSPLKARAPSPAIFGRSGFLLCHLANWRNSIFAATWLKGFSSYTPAAFERFGCQGFSLMATVEVVKARDPSPAIFGRSGFLLCQLANWRNSTSAAT